MKRVLFALLAAAALATVAFAHGPSPAPIGQFVGNSIQLIQAN